MHIRIDVGCTLNVNYQILCTLTTSLNNSEPSQQTVKLRLGTLFCFWKQMVYESRPNHDSLVWDFKTSTLSPFNPLATSSRLMVLKVWVPRPATSASWWKLVRNANSQNTCFLGQGRQWLRDWEERPRPGSFSKTGNSCIRRKRDPIGSWLKGAETGCVYLAAVELETSHLISVSDFSSLKWKNKHRVVLRIKWDILPI